MIKVKILKHDVCVNMDICFHTYNLIDLIKQCGCYHCFLRSIEFTSNSLMVNLTQYRYTISSYSVQTFTSKPYQKFWITFRFFFFFLCPYMSRQRWQAYSYYYVTCLCINEYMGILYTSSYVFFDHYHRLRRRPSSLTHEPPVSSSN